MLQYTPYTIPLLLAAALAGVMAYMSWQDRPKKGATWNTGAMASISLWSVFLLLVLSSTSLGMKIFWFGFYLSTSVYLTVMWFLFGVTYSGRDSWLTKPRIAALLAIPIPHFFITLTNSYHELNLVDPAIDTSGSFALLTYDWGPVVWLYLIPSYLFIAAGTYALYLKFRRTRNVYQKISFLLTVAVITLWIGNMITFAGFSPFPHMMMLPMIFLFWGVTGLLGFWSVKFIYRLPLDRVFTKIGGSDVLPLARDFVVQHMDSGVIVLDKNDVVVDINATAKKMIGESDRVVGKKIHEAVNVSRVLDNYEEGDELGELRDEVTVDTPEGQRFYDVSISAIRDGDSVAGRVVLIHDITRQKEREKKLERRETELERQKHSLEQQKNKLEHQNERLDKFASIVSHDLRNPLNVAEGYVDMVAEHLNGEGEMEVEQIVDAHNRMEDIIDDALALARQGKAITETEEVDLEGLARDAWSNVDTPDAELEVTADGFVFEGDRTRLLNVFENLFRNALEHGDASTVHVGATDKGFYVEDDGRGIPEKERGEVMEHGYTTSDGGTGLGLSIVQDVVRAHGWSIEVGESESGGARFSVECYSTPKESGVVRA